MLALIAAALLGFAGTGGERNDVLVLRDGRAYDGLKLELAEDAYIVHYPSGDVRVPLALVEDALMEAPPPFAPATPEEAEKAAKGLVPFEDKWVSPEKRDQLAKKKLAAKREELDELRVHSEWRDRYIVETKHFRFEYSVPDHVFAPMRERMEAYFDAFVKDWSIKLPRDLGRIPVYVYPNYQQFQQVSGAPYGVGGFFMPVTPMELDFFYDHTDPAMIEGVMFHETNHYLQKLLAFDFRMPHFPGESLAEYYAASRYDPKTKKFETGLVLEDRLNEVKQDLSEGETWTLEKLVSTDVYQHYTWGWSLVHFLMHHPEHKKRFEKFIVNLCRGKGMKSEHVSWGSNNLRLVEPREVWEQFKTDLGLKSQGDVLELQNAWHRYIEEDLRTASPQGKADAAHNAERGGFVLKAKRLYSEAIAEGDLRAVTRHRYASLLDNLPEAGTDEEAAAQWRAAVEADPMEALYRYCLGLQLRDDLDQREEGLKHLRLARDMNASGIFDDSWRRRIEIDWADVLDEE